MADESENFPLHECVFRGDVRKLSLLIRINDISKKDKHGNTALHLAVMLGKKECVQLLLAHGAPVKVRNLAGWSPLAEAISYGDRQTIYSLVRKLKQQAREQMEERRPDLIKALNQMGDFYMELKWDFQSWIPLVSRILPSDLCKIHKKGSSIRLDTTLLDFNDMRWERGDISFIFNGYEKPNNSLTVLDNKAQLYQRIRYEETEVEIEDAVDILMSSDITAAQMSTKSISFTRAQTGWIFREARKEMVGSFPADFYVINGMLLESRKRREHLSEEDLMKNKAMMESFTRGNAQGLDTNGEPTRRPSLTPPPESRVTWNEYISAEPGGHPTLGREIQYKETTKSFKATLAMSCDFPLTVDMLLNVLEVIAPFKHFSKLRDFIQVKLPPGFPVKLDIPILPTVTAKITFQDFQIKDNISPSLFEIPSHYVEDPTRKIFVSSSASAHILSPAHGLIASNKQEMKHINTLFGGRGKKSIKKSVTMPYPRGAVSRGAQTDRPSLFNCLESVENDLNRAERPRPMANPFKNLKTRKDAVTKDRTAAKMIDDSDYSFVNGNRLAIEFPMVLNVGSVYSSHVALYLDT